jgi:hypothetical protein
MESQQRAQVRLILEHNLELMQIEFEKRLRALQASNASKGLLRSGGTVKAAIRTMEDLGTALVKQCTDEVIAIERDPDAFSLIQGTLREFQTYLRGELEGVVSQATGHTRESRKDSGAFREADRLFADQELRTTRQLEIHRFSFLRRLELPAIAAVAPQQVERKSVGGRPLGRHWDELWATIAVMLYVGDLKAETQADIERAMKDWFAQRDLNVGDTPIRERARTHWRLLQQAD